MPLSRQTLLTIVTFLSESLFLLMVFMVPLAVTLFTNELFEWPKMMLLYLFTILLLVLFGCRLILTRQLDLATTPVDKFLWPFLILLAVATLSSVNVYTSLWGYYSRFNGSLLSFLAFTFLFYFLLITFRSKKQLRRLFFALCTSAGLVTAYGVAQRLGIDKEFWVQHSWERSFSTLGQPNWLAAFLVALIPLIAVMCLLYGKRVLTFAATKENFKKSAPAVVSFLLLITILTLSLTSLFFTKSRSGYVGLTGALICGFIPLFFKLKLRLKLLALVLICIVTAACWFVKPSFFRSVEVGSETSQIRLIVWKGTLNLIRDHPLLGTGPETFPYTFLGYRPKELNQTTEWDFVFNKPHNEYLGIASGAGIPGLIFYLAVILTVIIYSLRYLLKEKISGSWLRVWGLLMGYMAILITNFFGFSVSVTQLLFFLFPALILMEVKTGLHIKSIILPRKISVSLLCGLVAIFFLVAGSFWLRFWVAETEVVAGRSLIDSHPRQAVEKLKRGVALNPYEPRYRQRLAEGLAKLASEEAPNNPQLIQQAATEAHRAFQQNPHDYILRSGLMKTYLTLAILDPTYMAEGLYLANLNIQKSPTNPYDLYFLATLSESAQEKDEAVSLLEKALQLKPDYLEAQNLLQKLR